MRGGDGGRARHPNAVRPAQAAPSPCAAGRCSSTCSTPCPSSTSSGRSWWWATGRSRSPRPSRSTVRPTSCSISSSSGSPGARPTPSRWPSPPFPTTPTSTTPTSWSCRATPPSCGPATLSELVTEHRESDAAATLLTARPDDPSGMGRVVRGKDGRVARVVDDADATEIERDIDEVATSIYCFRRGLLAPSLRRISPDNAQGRVLPGRRGGRPPRHRPQGGGAGGRRPRRRRSGSTTGPSWGRPRPSCAGASTSGGCGPASP